MQNPFIKLTTSQDDEVVCVNINNIAAYKKRDKTTLIITTATREKIPVYIYVKESMQEIDAAIHNL